MLEERNNRMFLNAPCSIHSLHKMKVSAPLFFLAVLVSTVSSQSLSYKYKKISDIYSLPNNSHNYRLLLDSVSQVSLMYCMAECSQQADCALVMIVNTTCNFYSSQVVLKKTAGANDLWCQMNRLVNKFLQSQNQ